MAVLKYWRKILLTLLIVALLVVTVGLPYLAARMVTRAGTRPMDRELTTTPLDYGIEYEDVTFESADGVMLSGWYLGGAGSDVAVACGHGLFRSRREVLDRAVFFRKLGYDTLVFDFRRHGDSAGERVSLGYHERKDFEGAIAYLSKARPRGEIVLYGVSMGAAAAVLAAAGRPDVSAVIADSSFSSIEHTVSHHLKLIFGLPRFPFARTLLFFLEREADFDRDDFDLARAVAAIGDRPVLIVAGEDDERMPADLQRRLYERSTCPRSEFVSFPDARHGAAYRTDPDGYETMLKEFLLSNGLSTNRASSEAGDGDSSPEPR